MRKIFTPFFVVLSTIGLLVATSLTASAQSGSRNPYPRPQQPPAGSSQRVEPQAPVALEGYCPVSLRTINKWIKGLPSIQAVFDGQAYYFANQEGKKMFLADPAKYVPVLGGDSVVRLVKQGRRVSGNIHHATFHEGRLFLFANEEGKETFLANPSAYADADLAYGGNCVVCRLNMGQTVAGRPELTVIHKGLRYRFPAVGQRDQFLVNPQKYEALGGTARTPPTGSGSGSK